MTLEPNSAARTLPDPLTRKVLQIDGRIQGVGMRPALYRLAEEHGLAGHIANVGGSVICDVQGSRSDIDAFVDRWPDVIPVRAVATRSSVRAEPPIEDRRGLMIIADSSSHAGVSCSIPPDLATCDQCLAELFDPANRRCRHPFISCTDCGPRYTIAETLPWERRNTTMRVFGLCSACDEEYADPGSRRFHAETICCASCGPRLRAFMTGTPGVAQDPINAVAETIQAGGIAAIKGLGGYHLVCRADHLPVLQRLRMLKRRPHQPFAVMVRDRRSLHEIASGGPQLEARVFSPTAPIVVAPCATRSLLRPLSPGLTAVGVMAPYTPVHHLVFACLSSDVTQLVVTSANRSGAPLIYDERDLPKLLSLADVVLSNDRAINLPVDDAVVQHSEGEDGAVIRLGRGMLPVVVPHPSGGVPPILAIGADQKATVSVTTETEVVLLARIGSIESTSAVSRLALSAARASRLVGHADPELALDRHPDFASRAWAHNLNRKTTDYQHHVSHVASVMLDRALDPTDSYVAVAFDGLGYGPDGSLWGGEFFLVRDGRIEHAGQLRQLRVPRSNALCRQPGWTARALLADAGINLAAYAPDQTILGHAAERILAHEHRTILTSSAGRLFDAVGALVLPREHSSYEAQTAMEFEALAADGTAHRIYSANIDGRPMSVDYRPAVGEIVADVAAGVPGPTIARSFHASVARWIQLSCVQLATRLERSCDLRVILSGGVFQNQLLRADLRAGFEAAGIEGILPRRLPTNDEAIGVGQLALATGFVTESRIHRPEDP